MQVEVFREARHPSFPMPGRSTHGSVPSLLEERTLSIATDRVMPLVDVLGAAIWGEQFFIPSINTIASLGAAQEKKRYQQEATRPRGRVGTP
jgi:hypothetical protein